MAWRKPTEADLTAVMSAKEIEVFQRSSTFGEVDPSESLMNNATGLVRGYLRRGGVRMSPRANEVPEEILGPVMDYTAYTLCQRMRIPITKERTDSWRAATDLFKAIAKRDHTPEDYADDDTAAGGRPQPRISDPSDGAILG